MMSGYCICSCLNLPGVTVAPDDCAGLTAAEEPQISIKHMALHV